MKARDQVTRFSRYGVIGIATNGFCFVVFLGLTWAGVSPVLASGLVYLLGLALSYAANRRWSFRSEGSHVQDLPRFLLSYGFGLLFAMTCIWVLIHWLHPAVAQIITTLVTAVVIYACLSISRFGQGAKTHAD